MLQLKLLNIVLLATILMVGATNAAKRPYESLGFKPTAIPLLNFSSDDGTGYGLRASLYDYDGKSIPYRRAYSIQTFFTTGGKWVHHLRADIPNLRPGQRLEFKAKYEKEDFANYYGDLRDEPLEKKTRQEKTFKQVNPSLKLMWIRDLRKPWRLRAGFQLEHREITPNAAAGNILHDRQPPGIEGGLLFEVNTSLRYDTRDDYTNSTRGILEEFLLEYGIGAGGDFNGVRLSYEHRHFISLLRGLVLAQRANADLTFGALPFYKGLVLGGSSTVRGLAASRRRGEGRVLFNSEVRWQGLQLSRREQLFTGLLLFWDVGQVFQRRDGPSLGDWSSGAGAGLRFHWHSTIVRADYGISGSRRGIYITFSQLF